MRRETIRRVERLEELRGGDLPTASAIYLVGVCARDGKHIGESAPVLLWQAPSAAL